MEGAARLLQNHPNSPLTHLMLGEARESTCQDRQAEEEFKQSIALSPTAPRLHFEFGYLYWKSKRYQEAVQPLQEELRLLPTCAACYFYLADIAVKQGKPVEAAKGFHASAVTQNRPMMVT